MPWLFEHKTCATGVKIAFPLISNLCSRFHSAVSLLANPSSIAILPFHGATANFTNFVAHQ